ncbi:hypothetical protein PCASD_17406 [Puccinia coronata f. sp. avenae]|uniref:Uncharacterized protein n=1 Tax=Puccinia coronata f. sp. avenae TaxID=200324 RepID=A0A2N5TX69_9BASI|nr:hypothetical protein PCASD_17406 [Puccinia coronata f. sp. avenae]
MKVTCVSLSIVATIISIPTVTAVPTFGLGHRNGLWLRLRGGYCGGYSGGYGRGYGGVYGGGYGEGYGGAMVEAMVEQEGAAAAELE